MLREIRIQGLGVIDDAVVGLSEGLNVLTGETGAGKTMVVSALGLLLGGRADAARVREQAEQALVEGFVEVGPQHPAAVRAADAGADVSDGILLARTVGGNGRSRAHVGGRSAPVGVLAEVGQHLVVVHGQADQWRLQRPDQHRLMVDTFGGVQVRQAQEKYTQVRQLWRECARELRELQQAQRDRAQRLALLTAGLEEIERVDPKPGEDEALVTEIERLGNVEDLQRAAHAAHVELAGDEDAPASTSGNGAAEAIAQVRAHLQQVADLDASATELRTRADELGVLVTELAADVSSYLSGLEAEPERLGQANQRLSELRGLQRTYGDTTEDVLAWSAASAAEAGDLAGTDHRIEALVAQVADLGPQVAQAAIELTAARTAAAGELGRRVTEELGHLAMGSAQVEVAVTQVEAAPGAGLELPDGRRVTDHPHGIDDVEIRMAAGPGRSARNVAKAASGGELSRVMLALEVVTASGDVPTFVFDEVDAGVGGAAALDVGARLKALAAHAQVIVVTHLAQVAAYADHHLVVRKTDDGQITSSGVVAVTGAEREAELARMLGGMSESSTAREHARELLDTAAGRRG